MAKQRLGKRERAQRAIAKIVRVNLNSPMPERSSGPLKSQLGMYDRIAITGRGLSPHRDLTDTRGQSKRKPGFDRWSED